jgi:hypothetical protein
MAGCFKSYLNTGGDNMGVLCNRITNEEHERRLELHNQGLNDVKLAESVGVNASAIRAWRKKNGIEAKIKKGRGLLSLEEEASRMKLYMEGATDTRIAESVGRSINAIYLWRLVRELPPNGTPQPKKVIIKTPRINKRSEEDWGKFSRFVSRVLNARMNYTSKLPTAKIIETIMISTNRGELEA